MSIIDDIEMAHRELDNIEEIDARIKVLEDEITRLADRMTTLANEVVALRSKNTRGLPLAPIFRSGILW